MFKTIDEPGLSDLIDNKVFTICEDSETQFAALQLIDDPDVIITSDMIISQIVQKCSPIAMKDFRNSIRNGVVSFQ